MLARALVLAVFVAYSGGTLTGADQLRVIAPEAVVRLSPHSLSETVAIVRAGTLLDIHSRTNDWYGVFVPAADGQPRRQGYIPASLVEAVVETPALAGPRASPESGQQAIAYVLDRAQRTVAAIDAVTGEIRSTRFARDAHERVDRRSPDVLALSPNGSRLIVIDAGDGKWSLSQGWQPVRKSLITLIDTATLEVVARIEGVWGAPIHRMSRDGDRLTVVGPAYRNERSRHPSELVQVDLRTGEELGRLRLDAYVRESDRWFDWYANVALSAHGDLLYLLDRGSPSKDRNKHVNGRLTVIDVARLGVVATHHAGDVPTGMTVDDEADEVFLLSNHAPHVKNPEERIGELRVFRGAALAATIPIVPEPRFVRMTLDRQRLLAVSAEGIVTIDRPALERLGTTAVPRAGITFWTVGAWWDTHDRAVSDLVVDPVGRRAYAIHEGSSQLSVLDLDKRTRVARVTTGRGSGRVTAFVNALMTSMTMTNLSRQFARAIGSPVYYQFVYLVLPAHTEIMMRPDGRIVYVANWQTRDLTIVDAATASVIGHFADVGHEFEVLPEANLLCVRGPSGIRFIDMTTNREVSELAIRGAMTRIALSPDTRRLFVAGSGRVIVLDARTGRFLAAFPEFDDPTQIQFLSSSPASLGSVP